MASRTLGRTGLRVSDIGFGAMTIGGEVFGATDDGESLRAVNRFLDLGMNFIDTADAYGRGHSEELLAEVMRRGEIFERLERLKREGKIRSYGVSVATTADAIVAVETGKPDTIQVVYNILHQDPEERLFPLAQKENVGIIVRVPLERGILSGRFRNTAGFAERDFRRGVFSEAELAQVNAAIDKLQFLVKEEVPNLAQAALRYVLSHPAVSTVIAGVRTVNQVEDNVAVSGKRLPAEDVAKLHELYQSDFRSLAFH